MEMIPKLEKGDFFDDKQKQVKQKIMEDLLEGLFKNLKDNHKLFNVESFFDMIFSILVMFNREILVHTFTISDCVHRKEIMKNLFSAIKTEVNKKMNSNLH